MSKEVKLILEQEEGRVPYVYEDQFGYATIAIGRLVDKRRGGRLRDSEIDLMQDNDVDEITVELLQDYPWMAQLSQVRFDAFILMRFQLGRNGMAGFVNTLAAAKRGDYKACARGMRASLWARQTPARVDRLSKQVEFNHYVYKE